MAPMIGSDAPPLTSSEAKEWRRSWMRAPLMSAALHTAAPAILILERKGIPSDEEV
jgi:hypothetical protein